MEITKIKLINIRCFKEFEVDLSSGQGNKKWMVIIGDNGVGKTTILRAIALGLCEESGAAGLLAEMSDMIRYDERKASIRIELKPNNSFSELAFIETTLTRNDYGEIELKQVVFPEKSESFKWENLFACAYGVGRGVFGSDDVSEYAVTDSVYSLFNYKSVLQNPELVLRRIQSEIEITEILRKAERILMIPKGAIMLTRSGISVKNFWGKDMPFGTMGDGYASTLTWILDMYGWKLLYERHMQDVEVNGIILIDEIENHFHPKWQKQIINLLSKEFPQVQFIVTTHSPLCVIGATDLMDNNCNIAVLSHGQKFIDYKVSGPLRSKRVDQILTSYLFDLNTTSDNKIKDDIEKYNHLYNKGIRTEDEKNELNRLTLNLNETLGSAETELEQKVGKLLKKALDTLFEEETKTKKNSPEKFELIRQLQDLLK